MVLQRTEPTEEQSQQEKTTQADLHKSITESLLNDKVGKSILDDFGLSPVTEKEKKAEEKPKEEESEEEVVPEEETQEESTEETKEETVEETEEEEVIPKSKVQKRFDELTAKNKYLEQQIEELKNSKTQPKDEVTKQLEEMSEEQLRSAKIEVRKAQIKSQSDDAKLNELIELEQKIDAAMSDKPKNFAKAQQDAFIKARDRIIETGDIADLAKSAPEILKIANEIYAENPSFHKMVDGQATALNLAVKHYKAMNSGTGDKTKEIDLKRQVNNLKKKTTLDTKTGVASVDKAKIDTLRKNAIGGTDRQKVALIRSDPRFNVDAMIPEEFKEK